MVDLYRHLNQSKIGANNHLRYEHAHTEKYIPVKEGGITGGNLHHIHSVADRILLKLVELWSELESMVQHFNEAVEENVHHRKREEKIILKCEYLLQVIEDVLQYVLTSEERKTYRVVSGKYSFNRIKELVEELNGMDIKQLKHLVDKKSLGGVITGGQTEMTQEVVGGPSGGAGGGVKEGEEVSTSQNVNVDVREEKTAVDNQVPVSTNLENIEPTNVEEGDVKKGYEFVDKLQHELSIFNTVL
ncbi:hypothetical protein FDP41_003994 [Naegleria fowleri]|uniref:Uncharacterized protein n=1 Tax=Naegleria fowleri TaxID=5763 RepID=A0A6A5BUV1_NAEFO|nr:uncharacterized protein FDP41_003994 [Naegleria fowleri]KAF0976699.1 hypothetical protein FDP41_003994 [Naegleria fowleri]CAG4711798.1 unnamed protein product [Naegleria fowleri]